MVGGRSEGHGPSASRVPLLEDDLIIAGNKNNLPGDDNEEEKEKRNITRYVRIPTHSIFVLSCLKFTLLIYIIHLFNLALDSIVIIIALCC